MSKHIIPASTNHLSVKNIIREKADASL